MIIRSSNIGMNSRHQYHKKEYESSSLSVWGGKSNANTVTGLLVTPQKSKQQGGGLFGRSFSNSMTDIYNRFQSTQRINAQLSNDTRESLHRIQADSLSWFLHLLFGDDSHLVDQSQNQPLVTTLQQQFGGHYESSYYHEEAEYTSFQTTGTAVTADGRELKFHVNFEMSRQFVEYSNTSVDFGAPQLTDPLVVNLGTSVASVTDQTFRFDLDADGTMDTIPMLAQGSGYLALDKNGDGVINDGSELFGTASGNGFADLAAYDSDGNGWIDEADQIFDRLRIWSKGPDGKDVLVGLGAAGIGAIYLGSADTEFSLNSAHDNSTNAVVRQTGIFLYENGNVGTIQHVDMAKQFTASS